MEIHLVLRIRPAPVVLRQQPPTFAEDFFNIGFGVMIMPFVIPWGYVWRNYVLAPGDRWR